MTVKTQQEIVQQGYRILFETLGVADALRFIQYFSSGKGDYTQAQHTQLEELPLEDVLAQMRQQRVVAVDQYDEIVE
ncbi:MAG: hypothetical protein AAF716_07850 [Cyanobacteria bacterium P01_D01_bin.1]